MKIIPLNPQFLCGVPVATINPACKALHFLGPVLSSRGDALRDARKKYEKFIEDRQKDVPVEERDERTAMIAVCVESLKQQYKLDAIPAGLDEDTAWREAFSDHYTEDDLQRIVVSMRLGREIKQHELFDMAKESAGLRVNPTS